MKPKGDTERRALLAFGDSRVPKKSGKKRLRNKAIRRDGRCFIREVVTIVLAIVVSGCAMNRGGRLNETITEYDTDGNITVVTQTIVDAGRNYATVFAKQEKGATSFLYESTGEGKFRIEAGAVVDKQAGATPQDFGSAITGVVNGIAGIVDAITDNKETE